MALVTTPGSATADSYADLTYANQYASERRIPVVTWWTTATDAQKEAALRAAAILLDRLFDWTGAAVDAVQARVWPRDGMATRQGFSIGTTTIPSDLKDAQCEFALQLGAADRMSDNDALKQGITSVKAGSVAVSFGTAGINVSDPASLDAQLRLMTSELSYLAKVVPDAVRWLLTPSWINENTIMRPILIESFGGRNGCA